MNPIVIPELGEGITKATVACWHVKQGKSIQKGDDLVELVTDKAVFNVAADQNGVIKEILIPEGKEAAIGSTLAYIE
jgi:pyruvate/2-oxoglutarate dehydrogenase complex dihydrolipoamide acyltransferase (E2) component